MEATGPAGGYESGLADNTVAPLVAGDALRSAAIRLPWSALLMLGGTVLLTIALLFVPGDLIARLGAFGYLGVFILTLLSSASIVLPSPAVGVALAAGKTLNPWLVGLLGGVAAGLGEITGYIAGLGGSSFAQRSRFYPRVERWVRRWGLLTILVLAFIPGPVFDLAGIAAGTLRVPFRRFLLACLIGKVLRFIAVAWAGHALGNAKIL
ncbi:MAG TPA: VTT domain-containing protein [Roseiflexaceae bacterium]|nr:VTT domain-containing protein [Roseiflexaceae bacterium]